MALTTYSGLKSAIASWTGRSDTGTPVDDWIDLFEAWANRNIRCRLNEGESTTAAAEYLQLPSDFAEARSIEIQSSTQQLLSYVTPEYADLWKTNTTTGAPKFYTIVGNEIRLIPPPNSTDTVRMSYWKTLTALDGTNTSNWLSTNFADAYLYGSLMHARMYFADEARAAQVKAGWDQVVAELNRMHKRSNYGGSLAMRAA